MQQRDITLLIPGLLGANALQEARFFQGLAVEALELMLSRGRYRPRYRPAPRAPEAALFELFGHPDAGARLPLAGVTQVIDLDGRADGVCLRADPVQLQPDRDRVVMLGGQHLAVTQAEAQQLATEFNQLFAEDGLRLEVPVVDRWYLVAEQAPRIHTSPLTQVMGQDIHPHLPEGENAMYWHRLLNEVQMLFYGSPVNQARRRRGQPEINSLWFWGEGAMPPLPQGLWRQVWSNDILSRSLARLSQTEQATLPASAAEWLEQAPAGGAHLVVIEAVAEALHQHDLERWRVMMETVNEEWIYPLMEALRTNSLSSIRLLSDNADCVLDAKGLRRWWRRRRTLARLSA